MSAEPVAAPAASPSETELQKPKEEETSRLGKFIQTYSGFLSSFVIGVAGLVATSIWQYRQSEMASRQADSQQRIAETKAANDWRIERAEILSKNLQVLAAHGENTVEQRYGVLLSLTRGDILDPELAVSYALDLGKDSPEYMRTVLANTSAKSYARLASAYELTCTQRYGLARDVALCRGDRQAERSGAIADLIADELESAQTHGDAGPLSLLRDERQVQATPMRLGGLFGGYLGTLYERRQWNDIAKFESFSTGARLIAALQLAAERPTEFVTAADEAQIKKFHDERSAWLASYLFGASCTADCKGRLVDPILTSYQDSRGRFDEVMRSLLKRPRGEVGPSLARLHARLLACQIEPENLRALRDAVLVPVLAAEVQKPAPDGAVVDDVAGLLALVPEPTDGPARAAWSGLLARLKQLGGKTWARGFVARREAAKKVRTNPTPTLKKAMFCNANESADDAIDDGAE
jgi:hypothetical protein